MLISVVYYSFIIHFCFPLRFFGDKSSMALHTDENTFDKWKVNISKKIFIRKTSSNGKKLGDTTPHLDDNSVYVDGIKHLEIKKQSTDWIKIKRIEKSFKNMLAMKGVKFIYKRDMFWRTWRVVSFSNNSKRAVFYKCTHIINTACSNCFGGGFWIIEEDQISCPYDIYSMVNKNQICVANYNQMEKIHKKCPSVASLTDLVMSCCNPIITMYQVTKTLSHFISERDRTDICGGRENCGISTFYRINEDYITFRILDSSNNIIYSKIMKPDKKNFACVTNCGRLDSMTNIVFKTDQQRKIQDAYKSYSASWKKSNAKSSQKSKIQDANKSDRVSWKKEDATSDKNKKIQDAIRNHRKKKNARNIHPFRRNKIKEGFPRIHLAMTTTPPCCHKLQPTTEDYDEENYDFTIDD